MVVWGAVWGVILYFCLNIWVPSLHWSFGALLWSGVLGALAGHTLRQAILKELDGRVSASSEPEECPLPSVFREPNQSRFTPPPTSPPAPTPASFPVTSAASSAALATPAATSVAPAPAASAAPSAMLSTPRLPDKLPSVFDDDEPYRYRHDAGSSRSSLWQWILGGNGIVRIGILVLFIGLAFLAKLAIENAVFPPELRLCGIGLIAIALLVFGFRIQQNDPSRDQYALALQGAGIAVLYLTLFAAFKLYAFLPSGAAFLAMLVVCALSTAIALLQNAMPMAFIGFAGAFASPLLLSTGQGSHVVLFSYYLILNSAIAVIAWRRAWRALNLLGFFFTFGVGVIWGLSRYVPAYWASSEFFLITLFLLYVGIGLAYALRHGLAPEQAVNITLVVGTALAAMSLQVGMVHDMLYGSALSAVAVGGFYLALCAWIQNSTYGLPAVRRWLAHCYLGLGTAFVTMAIPLAFDARWTCAVWAVEGVCLYWLGRPAAGRLGHHLLRIGGVALQVLAGMAYLKATDQAPPLESLTPFLNQTFIGAALLAASAFMMAYLARDDGTLHAKSASHLSPSGLSPMFFWVGFLSTQIAWGLEIHRHPDFTWRLYAHAGVWMLSAFAALQFALPQRRQVWAIAATPAWLNLPVLCVAALLMGFNGDFQFTTGWWAWPVLLVLHGVMLKHVDQPPEQTLAWSWVHSVGVWLGLFLIAHALNAIVQAAQLKHTDWDHVIFIVAAALVLLLFSQKRFFNEFSNTRNRWPMYRFVGAYVGRAAFPIVLMLLLGCLMAACALPGNTRPLPYIPVLNPLDISLLLGLAACTLWVVRLSKRAHSADVLLQESAMLIQRVSWPWVLACIGFIVINTIWLRTAHHFADVPWGLAPLMGSATVQTGYSILWTLLALAGMLAAHASRQRGVWLAGAALLGLTVCKLFVIDLSNHGSFARIVSFMAVGILMLVIGYLAPLPPSEDNEDNEETVENNPSL